MLSLRLQDSHGMQHFGGLRLSLQQRAVNRLGNIKLALPMPFNTTFKLGLQGRRIINRSGMARATSLRLRRFPAQLRPPTGKNSSAYTL
jgi:hypothetical protein